ncbi:MAG TPA: DUF6049 family protein [Streptosporangiaceae bacterium]|nr:DUF6049 family protein [Streptosporangiaceae bacterium]
MARRAASALIAMFAFAAVAAPIALIAAAAAPAAAATGGVPATVVFTGLNPQSAAPGLTISVTGSVKNTSGVNKQLTVQLLDSTVPISSVSALQQSAAAGSATGQADMPLPHAVWRSPVLRPGASASWSLKVRVSVMGLTSFGVYPLAAQLYDAQGTPLNNTLTYLPYVPAKGGPYRSSIPAAQKISWVWPLIDQPLLDEPWQSACSGSQAAALAQSLTSGGRLGKLVGAAGATASTAAVQARALQAASSGTAHRLAIMAEPGQSLAQDDAVTWAVDPALLVNVFHLSQCGASQPQWARAASAWLARLKDETASQPLFVTPYGDPNVAALIGTSHAGDLENAFTYGRRQAGRILGRSLAPPAAGSSSADPAGLAWSTGGPTTHVAGELAGKDGVGTLLVDSTALPPTRTAVVRALNGIGGYVNVLLANDSLTRLLGSAGTGPGSAFTTAQQFLAETALLAQEHPSTPIIVAPPERWQPPSGLATALLAGTASAPWLSPATLMSLTGETRVPTVQLPTDTPGLSTFEQSQLNTLDAAVGRQQLLRAQPDPNLSLAVSTVESSAYSGQFRATAWPMVQALIARMTIQEQRVHIIAENRITLGGTRGNVPVSIDNPLPFPVRVTLQLSYSQGAGTTVSASPPGPRTVPAKTAETIRLRINAAHTGSTTVTMTLLNQAGQPLASAPVRTTVQTTKVGLLGMIIFGAALGVFLLASAARAIRRGKPLRPDPDEASGAVPREDDPPGQSTEDAAPVGSYPGTVSWDQPGHRARDRGD